MLDPVVKKQCQEAIDRYLANGGEVHRCVGHAPTTGQIRFNYATKAAREREEAEKASAMAEIRKSRPRVEVREQGPRELMADPTIVIERNASGCKFTHRKEA